jgi:hypothetical protein
MFKYEHELDWSDPRIEEDEEYWANEKEEDPREEDDDGS